MPEALLASGAGMWVPAHRVAACVLPDSGEQRDDARARGGYGGAVAGGSQGWPLKSWVRASRASMPHLPAVDK
jgi:hypothetical protein